MENKTTIGNFIENLQSIFKEKLDPYLSNILKKFSFEEEVKWRYEYFENKNYNYHSVSISIVFVKRNKEDDYGFDICFKIGNDPHNTLTTYVARGNGSMILDEKEFELAKLIQTEQKLDDLVYEYTLISGLLVKEYILEAMYQTSRQNG